MLTTTVSLPLVVLFVLVVSVIETPSPAPRTTSPHPRSSQSPPQDHSNVEYSGECDRYHRTDPTPHPPSVALCHHTAVRLPLRSGPTMRDSLRLAWMATASARRSNVSTRRDKGDWRSSLHPPTATEEYDDAADHQDEADYGYHETHRQRGTRLVVVITFPGATETANRITVTDRRSSTGCGHRRPGNFDVRRWKCL